jgi:beta-fructofuranosidase
VWGHAVSHDFARWTRLPNALWNDQPYDISAVYTGSATIVDGKPVLVYPGICHGCENKKTGATGTALVSAVPANLSDPLYEVWHKHGVIVNNTQRDPSTAWQTASGEWRFTTYTGNIFAGSNEFASWQRDPAGDFFFPSGECPSFFSLPRLSPGSSAAGLPMPTHVHKCSHSGDFMQVGSYTEGPEPSWRATPGVTFDQKPIDRGSYYASKDFFDRSTGRRLIWGWARGVGGGEAITMPREVTYHPILQQLLFSPVAEQRLLRETPLGPTLRDIKMVPGKIFVLAGHGAEQSEVNLTFVMPRWPAAAETNLSLLVMDGPHAVAEVFFGFWRALSPIPPPLPPPGPPEKLKRVVGAKCAVGEPSQAFRFGAVRNATSLECASGTDECDLTTVTGVDSSGTCSRICIQQYGPGGAHTGCVGWTYRDAWAPPNATHLARCTMKGWKSHAWQAVNATDGTISGLMGWGHRHGWLFNQASRPDVTVTTKDCGTTVGAEIVAGGGSTTCGNASNFVMEKDGLIHHVASGLCLTLLLGKKRYAVLGVCGQNVTGQDQTFVQANMTIRTATTGVCLSLVDIAGNSAPVEAIVADAPGALHSEDDQVVVREQPWALTVGVKRFSASGATTVLSETMRLLPSDQGTLQLQAFIDHTFAEVFWQGGRVAMTAPVPELAAANGPLALAVRVVSGDSPVVLESATAWRVGSMWQPKAQLLRQIDDANENSLYHSKV